MCLRPPSIALSCVYRNHFDASLGRITSSIKRPPFIIPPGLYFLIGTWVPGRGLVHPKPESQRVDSNLELVPPPGAIILEAEVPAINTFGSYTYIKYLLPEPRPSKVRPKTPKKNKDAILSDLDHCISSDPGHKEVHHLLAAVNHEKERKRVSRCRRI